MKKYIINILSFLFGFFITYGCIWYADGNFFWYEEMIDYPQHLIIIIWCAFANGLIATIASNQIMDR